MKERRCRCRCRWRCRCHGDELSVVAIDRLSVVRVQSPTFYSLSLIPILFRSYSVLLVVPLTTHLIAILVQYRRWWSSFPDWNLECHIIRPAGFLVGKSRTSARKTVKKDEKKEWGKNRVEKIEKSKDRRKDSLTEWWWMRSVGFPSIVKGTLEA